MPLKQLIRVSEPAPELNFDYDITIVGAGIAGTTLAAGLKNSGLKVALIEAQPQAVAASRQQVYAITLLSGKIFQGLGIWDKIRANITAFSQINLSDTGTEGVVFNPSDLGRDELGYAGEHCAILPVLQEFLNDCPNVTWLCPAELVSVDYQSDFVEIEVKVAGDKDEQDAQPTSNQRIRTRLLVAADGMKSRIRNDAGIPTHGWKYWQSCITTRVKPEKPHNNIAYERFWPSGPFAILPLPGNRCNIVWTAPHEEAKALLELDDEQFLVELRRKYGDHMGRLELEGKRFMFQVQLMQSNRYVQPRLALIGDAAHCCHPVGGQGLNLGIRDAAAIAQVLQDAHKNGEDIGSLPVLQRYEGWRKTENLAILGFTDILDRLFSNNWLPVVIVRWLGLWGLRKVQPVKVFALRLMTGLLGRTPQIAQRL
ncbi:FAD-dependent hydroxylase [Microcoleus sp. FACHB-672]|uniref:FAD-dependent hydroxylase n=1 Tax=Microcoleus sp. FACHB-672 TaxID=2692825 RepID=UPI001688DA70|nr:FAD-dependent hydroxylase [Microcoleus sp. FACHB-672]MBD2041241.1 FAD-dependent hydroxylase [Microcoleus sp. FACHB-672]